MHLIGNLTKDNELKQAGQTQVLKNTLAVKREFKKDETDFINIIAFGKTAELITKYTQKGSKLLICGRLQIGSYEKDGIKRSTADIIVENIEFIGGNKQNKESDFLGTPVEREPLPFLYMTKRNIDLVHREMRLYSILAYDEDCALNLRGEVLDTVYLGIHGNDVKAIWFDWDEVEKRLY